MRYTVNNNRRNAPEQVIVMKDQKVKKLVLSALMAALVYVATSIIQIPSPMSGYVNLGDCFVLLSGWLLGPWWGAAAGGIGSMLADLLLGPSLSAKATCPAGDGWTSPCSRGFSQCEIPPCYHLPSAVWKSVDF